LKIFSEVIDNAVDEAIKTNFEFGNKISIDIYDSTGTIEIKDNGRGLPIEWSEEHNQYKAVMAFTKLRAGSNFKESSTGTIGRFGVGVSLTNIFSSYFEVETIEASGKKLNLVCRDNISSIDVNVKEKVSAPHGTKVSYKLDFKYFGIDGYDDVHKGLIQKRIFDLAMNFPQIKFKFNGDIVRTSNFKDYVKLISDDFVIHEDGYKLALVPSEDGSQISFVNGIETLRGGSHIDLLFYYLNPIRDLIRKRHKIEVKPSDIRNKVTMIVSLQGLPNAKYDSQTKERLVNGTGDLSGILNNIPDDFLKKFLNNEVLIKPIIDTYLIREKLKEKQEIQYKNKKLIKKKIAKLRDATGEDRQLCALFLTEGDSASSQFITVRDQKIHACMPLRGKVMNVSNATDKEVIDNKEYADILGATGLHLHKPAEEIQYGKIVILTDMDEDGSSITALLINFFHKYWPELFDAGIIRKYLSPLIIATKKGEEPKRFYSLTDFAKFNASGWKVDYYKGLGSLSEEEYRKMINEPMEVVFTKDAAAEISLDVAFGSSSDKRKEWLGE